MVHVHQTLLIAVSVISAVLVISGFYVPVETRSIGDFYPVTVSYADDEQIKILLPEVSPPGTDENETSLLKGNNLGFDNAIDCLLDLETKLNDTLIDQWLQDEVPLLEKVLTYDGFHHVLLDIEHLSTDQERKRWLRDTIWSCGDRDNDNIVVTTSVLEDLGPKSRIAVLKCPEDVNVTHVWASDVNNSTGVSYDLRQFKTCEELEAREWRAQPSSKDVKLASCTIVRGDESRQIIHQWVEYHRLIGVEHFWIYMNEPWKVEGLPQLPYVTYMPYNFYWHEHSMHSRYRIPHLVFWHEPMQFQCLYRAKKYNIDWLITTDLDEYIWVPTQNQSGPVFRDFIEDLSSKDKNINVIGSYEMASIPYGRNNRLDPAEENFKLVLDHVWRNKQDLDKQKRQRMKMIYNTKVAQAVGIHYLWKGGRKVDLNPSNQTFVRHFKLAHKGVFLTGNPDDLVQDTELPDLYRDRVIDAMNKSLTGAVP